MVRLAVVGCGNMAHWHAQQIQQIAEFKVVAICDPLRSHTIEFREKFFNEAHEFASYEEMLQKAELDAVVLVTPHALHFPQAKLALERGLHVLVEKPMVTSSEHAYELWREVKRSGKLLAICFQSPYTPEFGYLAHMRDDGKLGHFMNIAGQVSQDWYRRAHGKWRLDPKLAGGGYIYDTGAHTLNAMMWLMNNPVVEVACFIDNMDTPVDIRGSAALKFANGVFGSVTMAGNCATFRSEIQIFTDAYMILTDQYGSKLEMYSTAGKRIYPHVSQDDHPAFGTPHYNFVNAIMGREPLRSPVRYGVLLSLLMDAMYQSASLGTAVKVVPVPEDIEVEMPAPAHPT